MDAKIAELIERVGKPAMRSIVEMADQLSYAMDAINDDDSPENRDEHAAAREAIEQEPLSIEVNYGWVSPGARPNRPEQFRILLATGGPAVRIVGDLNCWGEPEDAKMQVQDWLLPWTDVPMDSDESAALMTYVSCFYFGE